MTEDLDTNAWRIQIDAATPSLNELNRMHWAARSRLNATFGWLLASALNKMSRIPKAIGPRRLVIERQVKRNWMRTTSQAVPKDSSTASRSSG